MPYKATTSFVGTDGDGKKWSVSNGQILDEVPTGTDWLLCGFLEEIAPAKKVVTRRSRKRKPVVKKGA